MRPRVYLETSVISYLTARPARDVVVLAHQQLTQEWWDTRRQEFELFTSDVVIIEAQRGDTGAAQLRLEIARQTQVLSYESAAERLSTALLEAVRLPRKAAADMTHIAIAAINGMDYLLTWNCRHLANAAIFRVVVETCRDYGFEPPVICTPEQLKGASDGR